MIDENIKALLEANGLTEADISKQEPAENFLLEMAADHEFRLCELELFGGIE